ncbi:hypothetical protein LX64_00740 [Chitinophaga skermanii]|uniref:Parallel beta helix pectate lyase-like protein n=1 Tax=Chitinophaga skermanii TaxID=331697 RepID=A0A327R594_9BACT|nr:right-handed parallel beta-helix repeat-containing protein [Chitinophaga skermanii]RAJ11132.1 hypothetical protein LX64_00740 [Chitinophaga skermanii]
MKKVLLSAVIATAVLSSCSKKDNVAPPVQETVSGEVSGTWTKGGTYTITNHIVIPEGKSLTIEEGVTVLMNDTTIKPEIIVKGNLYSLGTSNNPVKFTIPDNLKAANEFGALWGGIIAAQTSNELVLSNTILEYGGAVTTESSASVKAGLYKAAAGEHVPALYYGNINGKLVVTNSTVRNFNEDVFYLEGGKMIIANNTFYTTGVSGGEAINIKSGTQADVAFNLIYSPNTNGLKLSNAGDRSPQAHVIGYNNTIVNAGWRRPTTKGGSIWVEKNVRVDLYNNLLANDRYGIKRDKGNPEDARSTVGNTLYYGFSADGVAQFQPSTEILTGTNDIISATVAANDPKFVNYPVSTASTNATFNTSWDFHLATGSPALGKGKTGFTRHFSGGLTVGGVTYTSPAPTSNIGAFGTK